jgi:hypothetical protein
LFIAEKAVSILTEEAKSLKPLDPKLFEEKIGLIGYFKLVGVLLLLKLNNTIKNL